MTDQGPQTVAEVRLALDAATADAPAGFPGQVGIADQFDDYSANVVRRGQAIKAVTEPDAISHFEYQGARMFVATRATHTNNGSFVLIAIGYRAPQDGGVTAAYRYYLAADEAAALAQDATQAFTSLLARYGIPYRAHDRRVLFLPALAVSQEAVADLPTAFELPDAVADDWVLVTMARAINGQAMLAWPFVIDRAAYLATVKEHQN